MAVELELERPDVGGVVELVAVAIQEVLKHAFH